MSIELRATTELLLAAFLHILPFGVIYAQAWLVKQRAKQRALVQITQNGRYPRAGAMTQLPHQVNTRMQQLTSLYRLISYSFDQDLFNFLSFSLL